MRALAILVCVAACSGKSGREKPVERGPRVQITYEIDLDIAVDDRAAVLRRDLEAGIAAEKIAASVRTVAVPVGALTITPADGPAQAAVQQLVKSSYGDTVELRECPPSDGPLAICLKISAIHADAIKKEALAAAVGTVRARLDVLDVKNPRVFDKLGQIVVEIPAGDPDRNADIRDVIARTGKLEMKVVDDGSPYMKQVFAHVGMDSAGAPTDPRATTDEIRAELDQWRPEEGAVHQDYYLTAHDREIDRKRVTGRTVIEKYLQDLSAADPRFILPDDRQIGFELVEPPAEAKDRRPYWRTYYLERDVRLTGAAIANAEGTTDPNMDIPIVLLDFNRDGARVFGDLTASIVGKKLATILDGKIKSAPIINGAIRGGRASITMGGSDPRRQERERDELVDVLKAGALPAPLIESSIREIN